MSREPLRLANPLQHYDWGSLDAIPNLLGKQPDGRPWAELWVGAHPSAPSMALIDGAEVPLNHVITADPVNCLGQPVIDLHGPRLPFLLKILAAARPLSLQVHPTMAQAARGYVVEEARSVPRDSPQRTYKDRHHKPELIWALTPFRALSGFRSPTEAASALIATGVDELRPFAAQLRSGDLAGAFWDLWSLPKDRAKTIVADVACGSGLSAELASAFPGDIGSVVALLLNEVTLAPGEGMFAPAGRLHAYLSGLGIEVLANSDNVVRAGLTSKWVDLDELADVLQVHPEMVERLAPEVEGPARTWRAPVPDFEAQSLELAAGRTFAVVTHGPEVVLCLAGRTAVAGLALTPGEAVFIPAALNRYDAVGPGSLVRVTVASVGR